jgi:iron(III) transport system permease protein
VGVTGVVVLALGVPVGSIARWLVIGADAAFPVQGLLTSAGTSLALGAVAAVVTTALALPVAVLAVRHVARLSSTVERTTYAANALPGIVVALALVTVSLRVVEPLYQTTVLLLAAYAVLYLPRAVVTLRAALEQAPSVLDEVAQSLGVSRWSTLRRVTLPLIARGSRAGAALVFLGVVTELTATLLLAPLGTSTLATEFWAQSSQLVYGAAAPYAALMILLSAPATFLLTRDPRQADVL